jgi:hypothetical protein
MGHDLVSAGLAILQVDIDVRRVAEGVNNNLAAATCRLGLEVPAEVEQTVELVLFPDSVHALVQRDYPAGGIIEFTACSVKLIGVSTVHVSSPDACRARKIYLIVYVDIGLVESLNSIGS